MCVCCCEGLENSLLLSCLHSICRFWPISHYSYLYRGGYIFSKKSYTPPFFPPNTVQIWGKYISFTLKSKILSSPLKIIYLWKNIYHCSVFVCKTVFLVLKHFLIFSLMHDILLVYFINVFYCFYFIFRTCASSQTNEHIKCPRLDTSIHSTIISNNSL